MALKKYSALLRQDLKNGLRDPMLMIIFIGSLLVIAISRYGVPLLSHLLLAKLGIDLQPYYSHITAFLFTLIPLLIGSAAGLLMLDEKDECLVNCYAVTPLRLQGYFIYRLFLPVILCALLLLLFAGVIDNRAAPPALALLLLVLEAPLYALFLASVATNKVEGLALNKFISLSVLGAFCISLTAAPWHWLGSWLPAFWPFQLYLSLEPAGNMQMGQTGQFLIGLAFHCILLYMGFKRFSRQI
jgi:fluoroquinolone transport system permease protein